MQTFDLETSHVSELQQSHRNVAVAPPPDTPNTPNTPHTPNTLIPSCPPAYGVCAPRGWGPPRATP